MKSILRPFLLCALAALFCLIFPFDFANSAEYSEHQAISDIGQVEDAPTSWRYQDGLLLPESAINTQSDTSENGIVLFSGGLHTWSKQNNTYYCSNGTSVSGAKAMGVDVSQWQGSIDWAAAKADGVEFAIIRCGWGSDYSDQDDNYVFQNIKGCQENGIPFGIYLFSYAYNDAMAASEAAHVLRVLNEAGLGPTDLDYPVYYDLECEINGKGKPGVDARVSMDGNDHPLSNSQLESMANTFCSAISNAGFQPGIYANLNWWNNFLNGSAFDQWPRWVAQYNYRCDYSGSYGIWQRMSQGDINGIKVNVDVNFDFEGPVQHASQWVNKNGKWWYRHQDGSYTANGWEIIGDAWYYFDGSGWMVTGWQKVGSTWYFLNDSGAMVTGWAYIGGDWYYFDGSGAMVTGVQSANGNAYHFASSGAMTTGWAFDDGTWYWSDSSGALASGWLSLDAWYWLDTETYQMQEGWRLVNENWYYLSPANGGRMCTGWTAINGLWYLFDNSGSMLTGWQTINRYWYLLNEDGSMATGWTRANDDWYWLDQSGVMHTGWLNINNTWYYLYSSGIMATGWQNIGGSWYYLLDSGEMATDWIRLDGDWYLLSPSGHMLTGWQYIGGAWYYLEPSGRMATGEIQTPEGTYVFDENGIWIS